MWKHTLGYFSENEISSENPGFDKWYENVDIFFWGGGGNQAMIAENMASKVTNVNKIWELDKLDVGIPDSKAC